MKTFAFFSTALVDQTQACPLQGTCKAIAMVVLFSFIGTLLAITGYKIFDICTPGKLHEEIINNRNMAAAMIGAAVILGVCIIVAAAMIG